MCPRLRRPAYAVGEVDGGSRTAPSLPNQRYDRPTVARASRKEEHRPSQRPPSGVRPTHAGHRGGPLRYQSPRRLPAHSGHPAASSAHPHPELHLLTPQGGTFRPWSSSTTVNAMTESGVPSSRQDTTPARPLASTARPRAAARADSRRGELPSGDAWTTSLCSGPPIVGRSVVWTLLRAQHERQSLPRPERLEDDEAREPGSGGATRRRHLAPGISAPPPRSRSRSAPFRDAWSFLPAVPGISSLTGLGNEISF